MKTTTEPHGSSVEFDFVKGHIAATMTLIHGLIEQGLIDRSRLDGFFAAFVDELPQNRETLGLRLIIDQWRQGLQDGKAEEELKGKLFEVINGGRAH
ncbi:hypothetical protein E1180_20020 [Roseibium denhamense]|uniref:Uncharacterized protein n=1 Tax=Roseibium denhamense TaxID=76305 RepID=A0ABY1PFW6_9HYPH|nr:hypothetical protein [Roseibium denhamense]MTI07794.1 hypothetical protein [Roseibium denhamense]SMP32095.1 hypothetical protein SAMN06265374_3476 [Roseibium denhamense]